MAVSGKNTRTIITLPKELKATLERLAKEGGRSLNNLMVKILTDYVRSLAPYLKQGDCGAHSVH